MAPLEPAALNDLSNFETTTALKNGRVVMPSRVSFVYKLLLRLLYYYLKTNHFSFVTRLSQFSLVQATSKNVYKLTIVY